MAGDRGASLIVRAAATGAIDFSRAQPRDPHWWRWLSLVLDELHRQDLISYYSLRYDQYTRFLTRDNLTKDSVDKLIDKTDQALSNLRQLLFPWRKEATIEVSRKSSIERMEKRWIEIWGDPRDPAVQRKIEATAAALRAGDMSQRRMKRR